MNSSTLPPKLEIAMCVYPGLTLLDLVGPLTALAPVSNISIVARTTAPLVSDTAELAIVPTATFESAKADVDVLFVPGGYGTADALEDDATLEFLARVGPCAKYVTSVCTGSLLLAAAGLLDGYRATTHWACYDTLAAFGVEVVRGQRVVTDRNRISGGGVTAGIDFGLTLLARLRGEPLARMSQLMMEYDPAPPFNAGSPQSAGAETVGAVAGILSELDSRMKRTAARRRKEAAASGTAGKVPV